MSTEGDLLESIRLDPENLSLRFVYADWLERDGRTNRAEFIRVQCHRQQLSPYDPKGYPLRDREQDLLREYLATWLRAVPHGPGVIWGIPDPGAVRPGWAPAADPEGRQIFFAGLAEAIELRHPKVWRDEAEANRFLEFAAGCISRVALEGRFDFNIASSSWISSLRDLRLHSPNPQVGSWLAKKFRDASECRLRELSAELPVAAFWEFFRSPAATGLRRLCAATPHGSREAPQLAAEIANSPHLADLQDVAIIPGRIGPQGFLALAGSADLAPTSLRIWEELPRQRHDYLYRAPRDSPLDPQLDAAAGQLIHSAVAQNLQDLQLVSCGIGPGIAEAIQGCGQLKTLQRLDLPGNRLGRWGAETIAQAENLSGLTWLNLDDNRLSSAGAKALAASPHLRQLRVLSLADNRIRSSGLQALAESEILRHLWSLDLAGNEFHQDDLLMLIQSQTLGKLSALSLGGSTSERNLSSKTVKALIDSPALAKLKYLDVSRCAVHQTELLQLQHRFGKEAVVTRR